jgi:hypothetical protein
MFKGLEGHDSCAGLSALGFAYAHKKNYPEMHVKLYFQSLQNKKR